MTVPRYSLIHVPWSDQYENRRKLEFWWLTFGQSESKHTSVTVTSFPHSNALLTIVPLRSLPKFLCIHGTVSTRASWMYDFGDKITKTCSFDRLGLPSMCSPWQMYLLLKCDSPLDRPHTSSLWDVSIHLSDNQLFSLSWINSFHCRTTSKEAQCLPSSFNSRWPNDRFGALNYTS